MTFIFAQIRLKTILKFGKLLEEN